MALIYYFIFCIILYYIAKTLYLSYEKKAWNNELKIVFIALSFTPGLNLYLLGFIIQSYSRK